MRFLLPLFQSFEGIFLSAQDMLLVQFFSGFDVPFKNSAHQNFVLFAFAFNHGSVSGRDVAVPLGLIKQTAAGQNHAF
jgi:hypothetical protein